MGEQFFFHPVFKEQIEQDGSDEIKEDGQCIRRIVADAFHKTSTNIDSKCSCYVVYHDTHRAHERALLLFHYIHGNISNKRLSHVHERTP